MSFLVLFCACDKTIVDHRYTGRFHFVVNTTTFDMNQGTIYSSSEYDGTIEKSSNGSGNYPYVDIHYSAYNTLHCELNQAGNILESPATGGFSDRHHLHFKITNGGLGHNVTDDVTGIRQ